MEIQRCGNIWPTGIQHVCHRDITVNGLTIPADTVIVPVLTDVLKGEHWDNGMQFKPERFLDEDGMLKLDDHFIPFSMGKRRCLGETLARAELFLFFTSLIHQYRFLPEVEGDYPTEDYTPGFTILPAPFKGRLVNRLEGGNDF